MLIGSALAWLNERTDARMGLMSDALPLLTFVLPPIAGAIGWVLLLSPGAGYINVMFRTVLSWFGIRMATGPTPPRLHPDGSTMNDGRSGLRMPL